MSSHDTKNPTGGVSMGHVIEPPNPVDAYSFSKSFGVHLLPDYGPVCSVKRPVRAHRKCPWGRPSCGVLWGLGEKNPRLPDCVPGTARVLKGAHNIS